MDEFTYENQDIRTKYETFEWDNTWIENANNTDAKRVLYIGDSISCGIRRIATELTEGNILFDGYGTSKGIDNPYLMESIKSFALQEGKQDVIIFNNGLHGWHLDDDTEYKEHFEKVVGLLLQNFKNIPVMLILTTSLADEERNKRVMRRNKAVLEIAKQYKLPVIDLYNESITNHKYLRKDGGHFYKKGYRNLAKKIVSEVEKVIVWRNKIISADYRMDFILR